MKKTFTFPIVIMLLIAIFGGGFLAPFTVNAQAVPISTDSPKTGESGGGGFLGWVADDVGGNILKAVGKAFNKIGFWVMSMGANLFDLSLTYTLDADNFKFNGVQTGWSVIRDVANMVFIFILLYIAIATILQLSGIQTKRTLITLIVVALLVNFSLFLTGVIIDAANILGLALYNALTADGTVSLSLVFEQHLQTRSLVSPENYESLDNAKQGLILLGIGIINITAAIVFLSGAMLLIARTVILLFALILSPIALAAAILPGTYKYFSMWFSKLIGNSFFVPIYLLVLLVVINILQQGGSNPLLEQVGAQNQQLTNALDTINTGERFDPSFLQIVLFFALVVGLLQGALIIARSIAGESASLATKAFARGGKAAGLAMGGAAFVGQKTVGAGARVFRDNKWVQRQAGKKGFGGWAARQSIKAADYGARSQFDLRAGVTGKALGAAGGTVGMKFGGAGKIGGAERRARETREETQRRAKLFQDKEAKQQYAEDIYRTSLRNIGRLGRRTVTEGGTIESAYRAHARAGSEKQEQLAKIRASFEKTEEQKINEAILKRIEKMKESGELKLNEPSPPQQNSEENKT